MSRSIALPALFALLATIASTSAQYTATYTYGSLPDKTEGDGQTGTNNCGTTASQSSMCQNVIINSASDFCLWGPPNINGGASNAVGNIEEIVVAYCLNDGYGTRLLPAGTITSAHFVKVESSTVSYVQVTGTGDFTKVGIPAGDDGGELDPHSWTGLGNPQGGLVFTNAFSGRYEQLHEWTSFQSASNYCIKGCRDGPNAAGWCEHIYDVLGCGFTIPGSFDAGFDDCLGSPAEQPGVYNGSTFRQGDPSTPAPHAAGPTSQCKSYTSVGGGSANANLVSPTSSAPTTTSTTATTTTSASTTVTTTSASTTSAASGMTTSRTGSATASPTGTASAAGAAQSSGAAGKLVGGSAAGAGVVGAAVAALLGFF